MVEKVRGATLSSASGLQPSSLSPEINWCFCYLPLLGPVASSTERSLQGLEREFMNPIKGNQAQGGSFSKPMQLISVRTR